MYERHQPHMLRAHLNEWCGGTEPPTIVTEDVQKGLLAVDIFEVGDNIHTGEILQPAHEVKIAVWPDKELSIPQIGNFACQAIAKVQ